LERANDEEAEVMKNYYELNMCFRLVAQKSCSTDFRLASHFACFKIFCWPKTFTTNKMVLFQGLGLKTAWAI